MHEQLDALLTKFAEDNGIKSKGALCVVLVVTKHAKDRGLPLIPEDLVTGKKGQVLGLGKTAVQEILKRHGLTRVLAEEGGRTSRGSIDTMKKYVDFLNRLKETRLVDLDVAEQWWIGRIRAFFAAKPFKLRLDSSKSLRAAVRDLLAQAEQRQREGSGTMYTGAVMQHLVGAKLDLILPESTIEHNGFSTKDEGIGRRADFLVRDTAIHVTTAPTEALLRKCSDNLSRTLRPVIITRERGVVMAEGLADAEGIPGRVDVLEIEQFIATNLYELSGFEFLEASGSARALIAKYNDIVARVETDPSLKIEVND